VICGGTVDSQQPFTPDKIICSLVATTQNNLQAFLQNENEINGITNQNFRSLNHEKLFPLIEVVMERKGNC
jgi:hypothetical protein